MSGAEACKNLNLHNPLRPIRPATFLPYLIAGLPRTFGGVIPENGAPVVQTILDDALAYSARRLS
jgi:hypothetical protein